MIELPEIITDKWDIHDVKNRLEDMHEELFESISEDKINFFCKTVLAIMQDKYDANIGYNWDFMDSAIQQAVFELEI